MEFDLTKKSTIAFECFRSISLFYIYINKYNQYEYIYINNPIIIVMHRYTHWSILSVLILIDSRLLALIDAILRMASCKWLTLVLVASSTSRRPPSLASLREQTSSHKAFRLLNRPSFLTRDRPRSFDRLVERGLLRPSSCINIADERSMPFAEYTVIIRATDASAYAASARS